MSREWQQTKYKEYVMPDAVYYQSLWAVRDLVRMENRIEELDDDSDCLMAGASIVKDSHGGVTIHRPTEDRAMEKLILEERINAIRKALEVVPEGYRSFVLSNIILQNSGRNFPDDIWKYWKQRFLHGVAKNMSMI